ncbi:MAG: sugar transferase [Verrucomicrobiae bacterium]|nr:sugar transferase [Verrucomicrobiae bacterium]
MGWPKFSRHEVGSVLALSDCIASLVGVFGAYVVRASDVTFASQIPREANYAILAVVITVFTLFSLRNFGLYGTDFLSSRRSTVWNVLLAVGAGLAALFVVGFFIRSQQEAYSRFFLLLALFSITASICLGRMTVLWLHQRIGLFETNKMLVVGWNAVAEKLVGVLLGRPLSLTEFVGIVHKPGIDPGPHWRDRVLGDLPDVSRMMAAGGISEIMVIASQISPQELAALSRQADEHMVRVSLVPDSFEILLARLDLDMADGVPILRVGDLPLDQWYNRLLKRLMDILGAVTGLVLCLIPGLLIALRTRHTSPGPIFFSQERIGRGGRKFFMHKFRTMKVGAEKQDQEVGLGLKHDPRLTPSGEFLRLSNLDELPQLWNVLVGEMSLVGPRPERTYYVEKFKGEVPHYMPRHLYKPGMTGLAQVRGYRGDTSLTERVRSDLEYLERWTLWLDVVILLQTLAEMAVLLGRRIFKR